MNDFIATMKLGGVISDIRHGNDSRNRFAAYDRINRFRTCNRFPALYSLRHSSRYYAAHPRCSSPHYVFSRSLSLCTIRPGYKLYEAHIHLKGLQPRLAVQLSGNGVGRSSTCISRCSIRRAGLLLKLVPVSGYLTKPPRPTQPRHPDVGRRN